MKRITAAIVAAIVVAAGLMPASGYLGAPGFLPAITYDQNFPDPHVIQVGGVYYAYATNTGGPKIPAMSSNDLETWTTLGRWPAAAGDSSPFGNDLLVRGPSWAARTSGGNEVWAPAVVQLPTAAWRAYYSVRATNGSRPLYCISVAQGDGPLGPFRDTSDGPLTCGYGPAGAIDPYVHIDPSGTAYLLWKVEPFVAQEIEDDDRHFPRIVDENEKEIPPHTPLRVLPGTGAAIWAQELAADGTGFAEESTARVLLKASAAWERSIIENPAMFSMNGQLHLFYSGNRFSSPDYATGWATCDSPLGPCRRASSSPILSTSATENGPGGASVFIDNAGEYRVAYHYWNPPYGSYPAYPSCDTDGDGVCRDQGQRFMGIDVVCRLPNGRLTIGVPAGWDFCDTDITSWQGPGVAWLNATGVSGGISEHYFAPNRTVTRAEVVTMLWRSAGSPPPATRAGFTDVPGGAFYTDAVDWAVAIGIVNGATETTFSPNSPINRAQFAAIMHRAAGSPDPVTVPAFTDVPPLAYFATSVAWLAESGITTGLTPLEFGPSDPSSRAQFATMLCRASHVEMGADAPFVSTLPPC